MLGVCEPRLTQVVMNCVDVVVGTVADDELKHLRARLAVHADGRSAPENCTSISQR